MPRSSSFLAMAAAALWAAEARGEPPPIRVDYEAHEGCPAADVFLDEIRWRTRLARVAEPGAEALLVQARVARRGAVSSGRLMLGEDRARTIEGPSCDEVVSALALITALAIDPRASTGPRPPGDPTPTPPRGGARSGEAWSGVGTQPPMPAPSPPLRAAAPPPPELVAAPLPVIPLPPAIPPAPRPWTIGARASAVFGVTPRALLGGGVFFERAFDRSASLRLAIELAATGDVAAGTAGASFLRGAGRIEGCAFTVRPASWLRLVPCVGAEGGALHGQGILRGALTHVDQATVPWAGLGFVPRLGIDLGLVSVEAQGGPVFALVRRAFVFDDPETPIGAVAPVTWTAGLGAGVHFP